MAARTKITHLVNTFQAAGAERMMVMLIERAGLERFETNVIALAPLGSLKPEIEALGARVDTLGMRPGSPDPRAPFKLARLLRRDPPDCLVTWQYHSNLLGALAARLAGRVPVVWNIHNTDLPRKSSKWLTRMTSRTCAKLSRRLADRIVFVAEASRRLHVEQGYAADKSLVIPNGFDLATFRPDAAARVDVRRELGISAQAPLVGLIARFHPQKDHRNFIEMAALLHAQRPDAHFLLCGEEVTQDNRELAAWIVAARLGETAHLLGRRGDTPRLQASLDVAVLSSHSEAFPLAIGEAMCCGVPAAVTDVGDTALLVGPTGRVVPPRNAWALAEACGDLLSLSEDARRKLGAEARRRIASHFNLDRVAEQYISLWSTYGSQRVQEREPVRRAA